MLFEVCFEVFANDRINLPFDVAVKFVFGLAFKLGLRDFDTDNADQSFADIITRQIFFQLLGEPFGSGIAVDAGCKRRSEAGKVRSAINGVDVVGKAEHLFVIRIVVLDRDLNRHFALGGFTVKRLGHQHIFVAVEVLDKF